MFVVKLSPENGGDQLFKVGADLDRFCSDQLVKWENWIEEQSSKVEDSISKRAVLGKELGFLSKWWGDPERPRIWRHAPKTTEANFLHEPIMFEGEVGQAVRKIFNRYGVDEIKYVLTQYFPDLEGVFRFRAPPLNGARALREFYACIFGTATERDWGSDEDVKKSKALCLEMEKSRDEWQSLLLRLSELEQHEKSELDALKLEHSKLLGKISTDAGGLLRIQAEKAQEQLSLAERQLNEIRNEFDNLKSTYVEDLKIKAAVKLWATQKRGFAIAAIRDKRAAWKMGMAGVLGAVIWVLGAYEFSGWLFSSAVNLPVYLLDTSIKMKPMFHFQLIFTSLASVFYITMYLWLMRLVVRGYLDHEHLRIDAMGCAVMAETYIALIKDEGATTDGDRAIVLASLFRPAADGLVKDDGPPALSLPAIISSAAMGRN